MAAAAPEPHIPFASLPLLAEKASLWGQAFGSASLLLLLVLNAWLSKNKKTPWTPGNPLVLGALSLQLLGMVSQPIVNISDRQKLDRGSVEKQFITIFTNPFLILNGRVVACVFMGNLLPDVARSGDRQVWSNLLALAISATSVLIHLSYETYIIVIQHRMLHRYSWNNVLRFYLLTNIVIFVSIVLLLLLLGCAALASKSIQEVVAHRIPVMLSLPEYQTTRTVDWWEAVEGQAVWSWIMARTYQPQYIIGRSVLSSSIGFLVTICVVFCFAVFCLGLISMHSSVFYKDELDWLRRLVLLMHWLFILLGWVIVCWRWLRAVIFYPKRMGKEALSLKQYFHVEEFWKNALQELQEEFTECDLESIESLTLLKRLLFMFVKELQLYKFLHILLHLQILLVLISKICWLISEMALSHHSIRRFSMGRLVYDEFLILCNLRNDSGVVEGRNVVDFIKYSKALMHLPGESPVGVWIDNLKSVQEMKVKFKEGESCGKNSKALVSLLEKIPHKTSSMDLFAIFQQRKLEVEWDFNVGNSSSKMTTVSLLTIIIELSAFYQEYGRSSAVKDNIKACCEAWRIMELVDTSDQEAALVSKQADRLFYRLKESSKWLRWALPINKSEARTFEAAKEALQRLANIGKQLANDGCISSTGYDSKNWKSVIAGNNLVKVCESIQYRSNNMNEMFCVIESSLAEVIESCMFKVGEIIMDGCQLWAKTAFMEEKLWDVFYEAGRAKGVTQQLRANINFGRP